MQILGNSARIPTDVILECHHDLMGDNVSIHLSQQPGSAALWTLAVDVYIIQGWYRLGAMITSSPALGAVPARTVAIASCPGAIGWRVIALCPINGEIADLVLQSSVSSAGAGVTAIEGTKLGSGATSEPWTNVFTTTALESSPIIRANAGTLRSAAIGIDAALASGTYYLQFWNLPAVPADGVAVTALNGLASPRKVVHVTGTDSFLNYDFSENGIPFSAGASFNLSTTRFTKTAVGGAYLSLLSGEYR